MIDYQPPQTKLDIVYCDEDILLVDKPAELLSVPGRRAEHQDCLISRIQQDYPEALIVHRLDMSTSGLMVVARSSDAQRNLNQQFEQRSVKKTYLAVVTGCVTPEEGRIELPLICDWPNRPRQIVDQENGKPAQTDYRVQSYDATDNTTRIELKPLTGRTHQLRVHMQALGHPILGDDLYADVTVQNKEQRLLLHATDLSFYHPETHEALVFHNAAPF